MAKIYIMELSTLLMRLSQHQSLNVSGRELDDILKEWFDARVQERMLWAKRLGMTAGEHMLVLFGYAGITAVEDDLPPHLDELCNYTDSELCDLFDLMMSSVLPKPTWNVVHVSFTVGLNVKIEIGQDQRILEWNRTNIKRLKREGLWKLSNL